MKDRYITALMVVLLVGCGHDVSVPANTEKSVISDAMAKVEYGKDPRSGLCFGVVTIYADRTTNVGIVNVPCKDVESLLEVKSTSK